MRKNLFIRIVVACFVALLAAGCGNGSVTDLRTAEASAEPTQRSGSVVVVTSPPLDADGCPTGTFEGVYERHQMRTYYECSWWMVDEFMHATYRDVPTPTHFIIDFDDTHEQPCVDQNGSNVADDLSYFYCGLDRTIYVGARAMWNDYVGGPGDIGHLASLAHETGHHIQEVAGVRAETQQEGIAKENQADCVMGAWMAYANVQGWLEWEDDLQDAQVLIESVADTSSPQHQTHGNLEQRAASFNLGFSGGIAACNSVLKPIWRPAPDGQ